MSVTITSQKFYNEFTGTGVAGTDYLIGSVGAKIVAVTEFYVKWSSENITVILSEDTNNNTIRRTDSGSFLKDGFRIGDSFSLVNTDADSGNYVIGDISEKVITITGTFTTKTTYLRASIFGTSTITASEFFYNLVENDAPDSFVSLVDNQTQQRYTVSGISATGATGTYSIATNSKAWAVDGNGYGVVIDGLGISNYKQSFRITHTFIITPIALITQLSNLQNRIPPAPDYMADRKCLKYLLKVNMKIEKTDPETPHTITFSRKGNTAWFDEFLNGGDATYSAGAITYTYGGNPVTEVQYDDSIATIGTFTLTSANSTFTTGTTAIVHIVYIPGDDSDYVNTTKKFRDSFIYDRATCICGAYSSGFGKSQYSQQFNSILTTFVNSSTITCSIQFLMGTAGEAFINGKDDTNKNYLLFVTVQDPSITTTKGTDMNSVIVDMNLYGKDKDDATLLTVNPNITFKTLSGKNLGASISANTGETILATVPFQVKSDASQLLYNVGIRIDAVYTGATGTFTLEEWSADTSDKCLHDGAQNISITQNKGYRLPDSHAFNNIIVSRNTALDTATKAGYSLTYPFVIGYESWRLLENPSCVFDDATKDWSVIAARSGWSIKLYFTATVYDPATDHKTDFEQSCIITPSSSPTGSTGIWVVVTTYDSTGINNQYGDILDNQNTIVVADCYGDFSSLPSGATGYNATMYLDQKNIGGDTWRYPFSSEEDVRQSDGLSPWVGATGSTGVCSITIISSTHIQVKAQLNFERLSPSIYDYNLTCTLDYTYP